MALQGTVRTSLRPGDRVTLRGYAINADYVTARYRTKAGRLKSRRIVVNQQTNTYSIKVRVLSGTQKVKLQGRRYDGAAGRVVTHKVSPFTSIAFVPFGRSTSIVAVPAPWGANASGSLTGGGWGGSVSLSVSSSFLDGTNHLLIGGYLVTGGFWLSPNGDSLQATGGALRSKLDTHYEGTGRVLIDSAEVFNGGFVVRNGGVELFVDGVWQPLEFADTDLVTIIATKGSSNLGN